MGSESAASTDRKAISVIFRAKEACLTCFITGHEGNGPLP